MNWMVLTILCYSQCLGVLDEHLRLQPFPHALLWWCHWCRQGCWAAEQNQVGSGRMGISCVWLLGSPTPHRLSMKRCLDDGGKCIVLLNWLFIFLQQLWKKTKTPLKILTLLGINFCVFFESTNEGFESSFIFQKGEELKPECETPWSWCCNILPKWPWAGQTAGLEMSKSVTCHAKCWSTWTCYTSMTMPVWAAVWWISWLLNGRGSVRWGWVWNPKKWFSNVNTT